MYFQLCQSLVLYLYATVHVWSSYTVPLLFACPCTCFVCFPGCSGEQRREEGDVCEGGEMLGVHREGS